MAVPVGFFAKSLDDFTAHILAIRLHRTEIEGIEVAHGKRSDSAGLHPGVADLHWLSSQRHLVGRHELGRPGQAG
jgi:hypothetical protein